MKISMISAGDKAPCGSLPTLMMGGKAKFCLHVNREATFLPQVHMPPCHLPEFYLWALGGSAGPHLKTSSLGEHRTRGEGPGSLDNLVEQSPLSCTQGLNCHALSHCPSGLFRTWQQHQSKGHQNAQSWLWGSTGPQTLS